MIIMFGGFILGTFFFLLFLTILIIEFWPEKNEPVESQELDDDDFIEVEYEELEDLLE